MDWYYLSFVLLQEALDIHTLNVSYGSTSDRPPTVADRPTPDIRPFNWIGGKRSVRELRSTQPIVFAPGSRNRQRKFVRAGLRWADYSDPVFWRNRGRNILSIQRFDRISRSAFSCLASSLLSPRIFHHTLLVPAAKKDHFVVNPRSRVATVGFARKLSNCWKNQAGSSHMMKWRAVSDITKCR